MKVPMHTCSERAAHPTRAFTLAEVLVATVMAAVVVTSVYGALTFGLAGVKASRDDLRATQVLVQQLEILRLQPYTSLKSYTTNIYYDPSNQTNGSGGTCYTISVVTNTPAKSDLAPPGMAAVVYYNTNMLLITATATWTNGSLPQSRSLKTYASQYGIQSYVYTPQ
jgi:Tfp pilus assembly protein PilV